MPKFLKELLAVLGKTLLALVLLFGLFLGYAAFSERSASGKAEDFCRAIAPGSATSALLDSAISHGADTVHTKWFQSDGLDHLPVIFSGATPLSRHTCWVKAKQGRVVSSHVVYLD